MFGLEFSLEITSVERLARNLREYKVCMFSTSVGTLSIWREDSHEVEHYSMEIILQDKRFALALAEKSHHQLEDVVSTMLKIADELKQQKES